MESIEMRWFFNKSKYKKDVIEWFKAMGGNLLKPEERVDYYLQQPKGASDGIKLREGNVEIKQKDKLPRKFKSKMDKQGIAQKYLKWKFTIDANDKTPSAITKDKNWMAVYKKETL